MINTFNKCHIFIFIFKFVQNFNNKFNIIIFPAFHEALGDAVALSVSTPKHLQTLGLIRRPIDDTAHDINFLFTLAMDKVVFLPFALAMDVWRWDVFNKNVVADHYNCHWWLLRYCSFQRRRFISSTNNMIFSIILQRTVWRYQATCSAI